MRREPQDTSGGTRAETGRDAALRVVEAWTGPAAGLGAVLAPDVVYTSTLHGRLAGRDAVIAAVGRSDRSLGGLRREARDVVVDGPFVAIRYRVRGLHDREYAGIPPTGREIETGGIAIFRLHDGQVVEGWNAIDQLGRLARMRAGEAPAAPAHAPLPEPGAPCAAPSRAEMETLAREFFARVWTAHPSPGGLLADDVVFHPSLGSSVTGAAGVAEVNAAWWSAFPDMRHRRGEILVSGDLAATWYAASGTDLGGFAGKAPTGRPVAFDGHVMFRVQCGRIAEIWAATDVARVLAQLEG